LELGLAAAHQLHEFLRGRLIPATDVAALLRHRATNLGRFPLFGRAVTLRHTLNYRPAGFAGRGFIANIDVALSHDCYPLLNLHHNAQPLRKVARPSIESPYPCFGSRRRAAKGLLQQKKVKKSH
jgi:hypothetical protein